MQVTNGTVKYGETRKIADFENKRADVELIFTIAEQEEYSAAIDAVKSVAIQKCRDMLGQPTTLKMPEVVLVGQELTGAQVLERMNEVLEPKPAKTKKPPKMPVAENAPVIAADPAEIIEPVVETLVQDSLDDILPPLTEEITDATLMDATTKQQQQVKNPVAVRKLITECGVKCPPGRLIDIPQDQRQKYLDGLKLIKPLA